MHYFWYYDTLYPDMLFDEEDMRYINFRYTDAKVAPDPLTAYYPYDHLKYGEFLNKKEENLFTSAQTYNWKIQNHKLSISLFVSTLKGIKVVFI